MGMFQANQELPAFSGLHICGLPVPGHAGGQLQRLPMAAFRELLDQEAERLGLSVEEQELRESITVIPAFQVDGRFDKDAYLRTLQANNLKPADFEEEMLKLKDFLE